MALGPWRPPSCARPGRLGFQVLINGSVNLAVRYIGLLSTTRRCVCALRRVPCRCGRPTRPGPAGPSRPDSTGSRSEPAARMAHGPVGLYWCVPCRSESNPTRRGDSHEGIAIWARLPGNLVRLPTHTHSSDRRSAVVGFAVRSGVALLGLGSASCSGDATFTQCSSRNPILPPGMTPGPDGALDARQGVGFPPEAQLGERILGWDGDLRSCSSSRSPPRGVDSEYGT